jgi:hypothetical protein
MKGLTEDGMKVIEAFESWCESSVDEKGIYPLPMVSLLKDGTLEMGALAVSAPEAYEAFFRKIVKREVKAVIFGLDRTTKPGQGTEFADVLTCVLWTEGKDDWGSGEWREWLRVGVINYQNEPRVIRPIDWKNEFWDEMVRSEMDGMKLKRRSTGEEL